MNTDPYQPLERESKQTRRVLELLEERGFSSCILTKSDLVERDIDLLKRMPAASVGVSVSFQDETVRKHFEQNTIPTGDRLKALRKIKQAGIETYVLISPLMPLITDVEVLIQDVCDCAGTLWIYPLRVESRDDKNWRKIEQILSSYFPMIKERFEEIVFTFDHTYWQSVRERLKDLSTRTDVDLEIHV
jgi:DNA repair photolyase